MYKKVFKQGVLSWGIAVLLLFLATSRLASSNFNSILNFAFITVCSVVFFYLCCNTRKHWNYFKLICLTTSLVWAYSVFGGIVEGSESLLKPVVLMGFLGSGILAYVIINTPIKVFPIKLSFYIITVIFYYLCFVLQTNYMEIFGDAGGGMMGTILIYHGILINYIEHRNSEPLSVLPSILIIPLCVYSISRTSLACSLLYFLVVFFFATKDKYKRFVYIIIPLLILLIIYLATRHWDIISSWKMYDKIESQGLDTSGRDGIWTAYLNVMSIDKILFGRPIDNTHYLYGFINPHNSLISLHSLIGLPAFFFFWRIMKSIYKLLKINCLMCALLFIYVIRGFFDISFFFGFYDFILFILVFDSSLCKSKIYQ